MARQFASPWRWRILATMMLMLVNRIEGSRHLDGLNVQLGRGLSADASPLESEQALLAVQVEEDMVEQSSKDGSIGRAEENTDRTFDVIIESSEDGKSTTFNPTPVFVIDFGRNVTAKNPLKMFEISGSNRVDVLYSPSLGLLFVMAAVTDRKSPETVTLQVQQGVTQDLRGQPNGFAEKVVQYAPYETSAGTSIISDVAGWGMLGGLALSFGATLSSPNAAIGVGAMNFAGFVQTFYMSGNLPISNMPENYRAAANGLDWVGLNPPYGPAAPSTNPEQEQAQSMLNDLSIRLPYPPKNITGMNEEISDTVNTPDDEVDPPADARNATQVVVVNLPEEELVDQDGKPPNPFKDGKDAQEDNTEDALEEDADSQEQDPQEDEDAKSVPEKVPTGEPNNNTSEEKRIEEKVADKIPLDADLPVVPLQKEVLSPPPPVGTAEDVLADANYNAAVLSPDSDDYAYVQPLFGFNAPAPAPAPAPTPDIGAEAPLPEAVYEDLYYTYEDAAYFLDPKEEESSEQAQESEDNGEDPEKGNPDKGNHGNGNHDKGDQGNQGNGRPDAVQDDLIDHTDDSDNENTPEDKESVQEDVTEESDDAQNNKSDATDIHKNEKELPDEYVNEEEDEYAFVNPLIGGQDDAEESSDDYQGDEHKPVEQDDAHPPKPALEEEDSKPTESTVDKDSIDPPESTLEEEAEPPALDEDYVYEDSAYVYEDPYVQVNTDATESEKADEDLSDLGNKTDDTDASDDIDEGQRRRKLMLADPLTSLASSGFSYVVATATPEDVSNNDTLDTSTEEAVGASVMSRIRAIQVSADGSPTDADRLDVLWNVLFWSAMLLSAVFVIHAIILIVMKISKSERIPKMLHLPRLELLTFTIILPMIAAAGAAALQSQSAGAITLGVVFGILIPFGYLFGAGIFLVLAIIRPTISKRRAVYVVQQTDNLNISAPSAAQIETLRHTNDSEMMVESSNASQSSVGLETSMLTTQMRNSMVREDEEEASVSETQTGARNKKRLSAFMYKWFLSPVFGFRSPYRANHGNQDPAWLGRGKLDGEFVKRFGCFFEDAHGPQVYRVRSRYESIQHEGLETANGGILVSVGVEGTMEILQTFGIVFAALKMVLFAVIINGPGGVDNVAQVVVLTLVALLHVLYLRICVPYRLRVELAAEIVAALCDMGVFICGIILVAKKDWTEGERNNMGVAMLVLQAVGFLIFITVRVSLAIRTSAITVAPSIQSWYRNRKR